MVRNQDRGMTWKVRMNKFVNPDPLVIDKQGKQIKRALMYCFPSYMYKYNNDKTIEKTKDSAVFSRKPRQVQGPLGCLPEENRIQK